MIGMPRVRRRARAVVPGILVAVDPLSCVSTAVGKILRQTVHVRIKVVDNPMSPDAPGRIRVLNDEGERLRISGQIRPRQRGRHVCAIARILSGDYLSTSEG